MDLISRRKMLLIGASLLRNIRGRRRRARIPMTMRDEDPRRERDSFQRSPHLSFSRSTSKNSICGGRINEWSSATERQTMRSPLGQGFADLAVDGEETSLGLAMIRMWITLVPAQSPAGWSACAGRSA